MKRRKLKPLPRCKASGKAMIHSERAANVIMMRIWSHDPSVDIHDMHVYVCPSCGCWHVGHISYYQKTLEKQNGRNINTTPAPTS